MYVKEAYTYYVVNKSSNVIKDCALQEKNIQEDVFVLNYKLK